VWTAPLGFDNTFALVIRGDEPGVRTISDAVPRARDWRAAFGYEFKERADGYPGLERVYGLRFKEIRIMDLGLLYRALVDRQAGRIRATVTSAGPLSEHELERLREAIGRTTGRAVVLESKTDSSLIGGVVAQVGPTMLDGSLRTQLERMRRELKRAPL